jgi:plasmid stability protein
VTYQLHLNISDDLEKDLRVFADEHELSISAAVRLLLREAMNGTAKGT